MNGPADFPTPPSELVGAPTPSPAAVGPIGPSPEEYEAAAQSYARWSGQGLDLITAGRGFAGRTPDEQAAWLQCWREEVKARPILLKGASALPPELGFLFFLVAYVNTRKEWAARAAAEEAAKGEQEQAQQ